MNLPPDTDILLYDSMHTTMNHQTKLLLSELVHCTSKTFTVGFSNVYKQSGSADCGLFSIAYITDLAFGKDPSLHVYQQSGMREHLFKCFQKKQLEPFPVLRERRVTNRFKFVKVEVHCYCRRTDYYGTEMYFCDGVCGEWYHLECISNPPAHSEEFYCTNCLSSP